MKKIKQFFGVLMILWIIPVFLMSTAFACTPGACLVNGHNQDTLFLGEVISETKGDLFKVKVTYLFPQNKLKEIKKDAEITVSESRVLSLTKEDVGSIRLGREYLFSLNKDDDKYFSAWGIYEVGGDCFSGFGLKKSNYFDADVIDDVIKSVKPEKCRIRVGST